MKRRESTMEREEKKLRKSGEEIKGKEETGEK